MVTLDVVPTETPSCSSKKSRIQNEKWPSRPNFKYDLLWPQNSWLEIYPRYFTRWTHYLYDSFSLHMFSSLDTIFSLYCPDIPEHLCPKRSLLSIPGNGMSQYFKTTRKIQLSGASHDRSNLNGITHNSNS